MIVRSRQIAAACLATFLLTAAAADDDNGVDGLPLFAQDDVLEITIEGPLKTLIRERSDEDYLDGRLVYADADGTVTALDLKFRARGNYRRQKRICRFPPVRLNLRKQQVTGTIFEGQNILKLVSHCRPGSGRYEEYVVREQLAYEILNLHTPVSFRSRLLRVTWVDTESRGRSEERFAFVIEHKNELEARTGMLEAEIERADYDNLDPRQGAITALFEYLIGNTDFSMVAASRGETCCHNGILLGKADEALYFVPYDFDMSGIVDAPYAEPNPKFELRSVRSRLYRGNCRFNAEVADAVALYQRHRDAVMQLIAGRDALDERTRERIAAWVDDFYGTISDPGRLDGRITRNCI